MAWNTVHCDNKYRFKKAKEQQELACKYLKKFDENEKEAFKNEVIYYVHECLKKPSIDIICDENFPYYLIKDKKISDIYKKLEDDYKLDRKNIVWMKFTKKGFLGVVAVSDDINFEKPNNKEDYDKKKRGKWEYNTSGIIIHYLKEEWDESFVLVFPLYKLPKNYTRHSIEKKIGNYLIKKGIPILDFYSHRIGGK